MIRKILVPVRGDGKGDNVLAHAAALARESSAHIEVTHCRARPEDLMPYGVPIPSMLRKQLLENASKVSDVEEQGLRQELEALSEKLNLKTADKRDGKNVTVSFVEEAGRQVDVIRRHGRLADVIAVAKPDVDRNLGANTLKTALFRTGRPVLMCPTPKGDTPTVLGQNIAVAWNGSLEATRAVALTIGLMRSAKTVTILTTEDAEKTNGADELKEFLAHHGIDAKIAQAQGSRTVAKSLLATSQELGADLMIMGAYGDSHERETVFGGNTQYVVDHAEMPVILVH